ncbi:hypothetical protein C8F01DRAFT_1043346 [Mycena amicta]|nr:hypothetical protein C8F01DRAFT_1043346 [Mycena amicta]
MDTTKDWQPIDEFVDAIAGLEDITTFHTDPIVGSIRANLIMRDAEETVSALEVLGIAKAVQARFRSTKHAHYAAHTMYHAAMFRSRVHSWFIQPKGDYHTFLFTQLDWVHTTHLCPVTTYLQFILRNTPMLDWAAAATADKDASPLAFAWVWARSIGGQTADIAALVTMGCHVHRLMLNDERVKRKAAAETALDRFGTKFFKEGVWAALGVAVQDFTATWLQPPSELTNSKRALEAAAAEELQAMMQNAVERLRKQGEQYAQLLEEDDTPQEREAAASSIRALAGFILGKADVPERALADLTTA